MATLNFNPSRAVKKLITAPVFIAVEGIRALKDGYYYASDVAETLPDVTKTLPDVAKTIPDIARTLPELPTKVEETKSILLGKIMGASAAVLNIPSALYNVQENISQKGRSAIRSLSPGPYFNRISSSVRNSILSFYELDEKSKENDDLSAKLKFESRQKKQQFSKKIDDTKESIYSTIDQAVKFYDTSESIINVITESTENVITEIQEIPEKIEKSKLELDSNLLALQQNIDLTKEKIISIPEKVVKVKDDIGTNLVTIQQNIDVATEKILLLPAQIETQIVQTVTEIKAIPTNVQNAVDSTTKKVSIVANDVWRVITLQDIIASIKEFKNKIENFGKPSTSSSSTSPKSEIKNKPIIPVQAVTSIQTTVVIVSSLFNFMKKFSETVVTIYKDLNGLYQRVDRALVEVDRKEALKGGKSKKKFGKTSQFGTTGTTTDQNQYNNNVLYTSAQLVPGVIRNNTLMTTSSMISSTNNTSIPPPPPPSFVTVEDVLI